MATVAAAVENAEEIDLKPLPSAVTTTRRSNDTGVGFHYELPSRKKTKLLSLIVCLVLLIIAGIILGLAVWMNGPAGSVRENASNSTRADTWASAVLADATQTGGSSEAPHNQPVPVPRGQVVVPLLPLPEVTIRPTQFCTPSTSNRTARVLIAIVTKPEDGDVRNNFRQIWSNYLVLISGELVFVIASSPMTVVQDSIQAEAERFGDILQIRNQTNPTTNYLKTLASLDWAAENCPHLFLVRMNVDVLVQLQSLRRVLDDLSTSTLANKAMIVGDVIQEEHDSTQRVSSNFLRFVYGSFYIVTRPAFRLVVDGCRARRPVSLEEVYLTGTCADYSNVERIDLVERYHVDMERELKLWRKMFSCLPAHVISVSNVGKDNVFLYWNKAIRDGCYL